jgi:hypothetical protein
MLKFATSVSILTVALCACVGEEAVNNKEPASAEERASMRTEEELQRRLEVRQRAVRRVPEQPAQEAPANVIGEVPDSMLQAMKEDLVERLSASIDEIEVIKAESITWNDGSLGCPKPGQNYTQALVPGYWIILVRGSDEYDYRASERGYFFLCELPRTLDPRDETQ